MTKLEKLYSIIENSRDVGVKLPKGVLQQVEELELSHQGAVPLILGQTEVRKHSHQLYQHTG